MKVFSCNYWPSLRQYGINPLTGEACGYGLRVLCDLTNRGERIITGYFGLIYEPDRSMFPTNWNSEVNGSPAVASVMLPREILQSLLVYISFHVDDADVVVIGPSGEMIALRYSDPQYDEYMRIASELKEYEVLRNPINRAASYRGRNIHAMSGRVE
jgi:hypothetical protein